MSELEVHAISISLGGFGAGAPEGIDAALARARAAALGYPCTEHAAGEAATHVVLDEHRHRRDPSGAARLTGTR